MQNTQSGNVYVAAFNGANTANGGEIIQGSCSIRDSGPTLLLVGDEAVYPDGSTAVITAGAGIALVGDDRPAAIIGSPLSNGDTIVSSSITALTFDEPAGAPVIGLLDPAYRPEPATNSVI
ncbi:PAAR domain-containing protein [Ralstonia pickettii]|uniref:PAAR domain-containing protein n=1 Tax=Ralstonia pickettii TaxID=329 RepID=UPI000818B6D3|nr:PAAR domain-containing protein [Ralstonia pickettii]OCS45970.1 hypothetical protein BEK67_02270 [Ralstonia pickettii]